MSRALNKVMLIGNVGVNPEVRTTQNGSRVATFTLATSRQWNDSHGEKQEKTEWHRLVAWNNRSSTLADIVERYVTKGAKLYIEGSIEYRQFQDKEGQTRYVTEINVRELIMLGEKRTDGAGAIANHDARAKAKAGASTRRLDDGDDFSDFPGALEDDDGDDLPF